MIIRNEKGKFLEGKYARYGFKKGDTSWNKGKITSPEIPLKIKI